MGIDQPQRGRSRGPVSRFRAGAYELAGGGLVGLPELDEPGCSQPASRTDGVYEHTGPGVAAPGPQPRPRRGRRTASRPPCRHPAAGHQAPPTSTFLPQPLTRPPPWNQSSSAMGPEQRRQLRLAIQPASTVTVNHEQPITDDPNVADRTRTAARPALDDLRPGQRPPLLPTTQKRPLPPAGAGNTPTAVRARTAQRHHHKPRPRNTLRSINHRDSRVQPAHNHDPQPVQAPQTNQTAQAPAATTSTDLPTHEAEAHKTGTTKTAQSVSTTATQPNP